ncbi:MAG: (d)CMP kinase [Kiritimatiellia bacterium]
MKRVIAIDGPSGAGKSSVSKNVGKQLGFKHVDSGALYRIITWQCLEKGIDTSDPKAVAEFARNVEVDVFPSEDAITYRVEGTDPGSRIRTPQINKHASPVATVKEVRNIVTDLLRSMTQFGDIIVEGRDITTAVFPNSPARFYLDASPEARAERRRREELLKGIADQSLDDVRKSLLARDRIDSSRQHAPLRKADGALLIDSTKLTLEQVIETVISALPEDWKKESV